MKAQPKVKYFLKASVSLLLGCITTLVLGECVLRLVIRFNLFNQLDEPGLLRLTDEELNDPNLIRIVTLGESTTATFIPPQKYPDHYQLQPTDPTWPAVLERRLNSSKRIKEKGKRVLIVNLGKANINSVFAFELFKRTLPRINPHMIITMLGINDTYAILPNEEPFYKKSLMIRFILQAFKDYQCSACYHVIYGDSSAKGGTDSFGIHSPIAGKYAQKSQRSATPKNLTEYYNKVSEYEALISENPDIEPQLALVEAERLHIITISSDILNKTYPESEKIGQLALQKARSLVLKHEAYASHYPNAIKLVCFLDILARENKNCLRVAAKGMENGVPLSPELLTVLAGIEQRDSLFTKIAAENGYSVQADINPKNTTLSAYRSLKELTQSRSIHWFAMQYPTGTLAGIKSFIWPNPQYDITALKVNHRLEFPSYFYSPDIANWPPKSTAISLISNQNFESIVTDQNRELYFSDLFGKSIATDFGGLNFGHTTPLGHELIADNAYMVVEPYIAQWIEQQKR